MIVLLLAQLVGLSSARLTPQAWLNGLENKRAVQVQDDIHVICSGEEQAKYVYDDGHDKSYLPLGCCEGELELF